MAPETEQREVLAEPPSVLISGPGALDPHSPNRQYILPPWLLPLQSLGLSRAPVLLSLG